MGRELDEAYFQSCECTRYEPLLGKMVQAINRLEKAYETGASVTVGTTNTLEPGQEAYVVNSGTDKRARLQFGIPRGADGKPGKDGVPGTKGDKGDKGDSYTITEADYDAIAAIAESDLQPKLDAKANIASPAFTGKPTVPYPTAYNAGQIANMRWVNERVASIASYPYRIKDFQYDDEQILIQYDTGFSCFFRSTSLRATDINQTLSYDNGSGYGYFHLVISDNMFTGYGNSMGMPIASLYLDASIATGIINLGVIAAKVLPDDGVVDLTCSFGIDRYKTSIVEISLEKVYVSMFIMFYE